MNSLPVFEMVINKEETSDVEVSFVALVDKPAIERNFLAFKDNKTFFVTNDEKRIISGPAMVADSLIYRKDENGEYNVFFSKETIREIVLKFFKKDYQKNINLFHDPSLSLEGVTIFESFVSDKERGVQPMKGFEDLPEGSWFISAKIDNEDVWQKIKSGEVKGFSVEGIFSYVKSLSGKEKHISHFEESYIMSELKDLWNQFKDKFLGEVPANPDQKMATEYQTKDGVAVMIDTLAAGGIVMVGDAPAPAGTFELADGTQVTVGEGGVISEVKAPEAAQQDPNDYGSRFTAIDEKFTAYEAKFTEQANAITQISEAFSKQNEALTSLMGIVGKIIETPTADPVSEQKNKFETEKVSSKEEKRKELIELFKKVKNK